MDLNHLRSFLAVAKHQSFSKASQEIYLTQPAISKHIQALEEELETKLFYRLRGSVRLTEAGEVVHRYATQIFQTVEDIRDAMDELRGVRRGHLRISAASTIGVYMLPRALGQFRHVRPGIEISLTVSNKNHVLEHVLQQGYDLGFVGPPLRAPELEKKKYMLDDLMLIVAPEHRLAHEGTISVTALKDEVFILREKGSGTREIMEEELARFEIIPQKAMELGSTEAVKQAVAANLGVSFVSKFAITLEMMTGRLCALRVSELNLQRQLYVIYHPNRPVKWAARAFLDFLDRGAALEEAAPPPRPDAGP